MEKLIKINSNTSLLFKEAEPQSTVSTNDYLTIDFEFHYYKDLKKTTLFREFHIDSPDPLTRAIEQALFLKFCSYGYFDICYEDGIPCLSKTILD